MAAMRLHPASAPVQLRASGAIHNVVWNGTRFAAPRARAQFASLTRCLHFFKSMSSVSLCALCAAGNGNRARALQAGAVPALEAALLRFPAEADLQTSAKGAIDKIKAGG